MINEKRNDAIDILKFLAVILVAHSHMDALYPRYSFICTGGAIGDALFFFISGYTLLFSPWKRFDNWYKRRIQRIYPTIIAWAIFACVLFGSNGNAVDILLRGGGYFVSCIMVFYVLIYFVGRYLTNLIKYICPFCFVMVAGTFLFFPEAITDNMYSSRSIAWPIWNFAFMLMGAALASYEREGNSMKCRAFSVELLFTLLYVFSYYSILYMSRRLNVQWLQLIGLLPLTGVVLHLYQMMKSEVLQKIYHQRGGNIIIYGLGQLCLEVYIIQPYLFLNKWNEYFPLNVIVAWIVVFVLAYILKISGNFVGQTFKSEDYDWYKMIKL